MLNNTAKAILIKAKEQKVLDKIHETIQFGEADESLEANSMLTDINLMNHSCFEDKTFLGKARLTLITLYLNKIIHQVDSNNAIA